MALCNACPWHVFVGGRAVAAAGGFLCKNRGAREARVGFSGVHRVAMTKTVEGAQVLGDEDDVLFVVVKGDEPAPKEE